MDPGDLFTTFADRSPMPGSSSDTRRRSGFGDFGAKLLNGAKEALRQLTYWQMKNRGRCGRTERARSAIDRLAAIPPTTNGRLARLALDQAGREACRLRLGNSPASRSIAGPSLSVRPHRLDSSSANR